MLFSDLAHYLQQLEKTSSRNEMTRILSGLLRKAGAEEIEAICYLLSGRLLPSYYGLEFNLAEKMMVKVLVSAYEIKPQEVRSLYKAKGDLGDVAYELAKERRHGAKQLSVKEVYVQMLEIARESGEGSQERKITKMSHLVASLDSLSAKYVSRMPVGKLRLGFSDATLLDAFSLMETGDKSARKAIESAYNVTADIGAIGRRIKTAGLAGLKKLKPKPGIPLRPSLAERLSSAEEAVEKAGPEVGIEPKLDGFRTAIHVWHEKGGKQAALFSRNLENTTHMFPEIVESAKKLDVASVILDGETIAFNPKSGEFLPFQETVQRKRKHEIEAFAKKIPLSIFVFDLLYLDGRSLLHLPFRERRKALEDLFIKIPSTGAIRLAQERETSDPKIVEEELAKNIGLGLEGVVVKNLEVPYQAGNRGFHWIKLKAATAALEQLRAGAKKAETQILDTIDCVVMGVYKGRGKRTQFGLGGFLLGVPGKDDSYYTISRLGTGLSDEQFREAQKRAEQLKVKEQPKEYVVEKEITPDVWIRPALVVEILADAITLSPRHTAGRKEEGLARRSLGEGGRGYSLRFPRLVRFRSDKNPEDATTIAEIRKLYQKQKRSAKTIEL